MMAKVAPAVLAVGVLLGTAGFASGQICNANDKDGQNKNAFGKVVNEGGGGGLLIPAFKSYDCPTKGKTAAQCTDGQHWDETIPDGIAIVYFAFLLWMFMGVGVVSDKFMEAIEQITSKVYTKKVKVEGGGFEMVEFKFWNPTVANLTLMALGSSAPEILLSVIEILTGEFFVGDLGASTIVGSAAFNLMVISAVCMSAIPEGVRTITQIQVFLITAFFSVFAYIWLFLILAVISPDVVEVWEAALTFMFFPILGVIAYFADKGYFDKSVVKKKAKKLTGVAVGAKNFSPKDVAGMLKGVGAKSMKMSEAINQAIWSVQKGQEKSRLAYRMDAMRKMTGQKGKFAAKPKSHANEEATAIEISMQSSKVRATEADGKAIVKIIRFGGQWPCSVSYRTETGTAGKDDFVHKEGVIKFAQGEMEKIEEIVIVDDDEDEDDEEFYFKLSDPKASKQHQISILSDTCTIVITGDKPGGSIEWNLDAAKTGGFEFEESCGHTTLPLVRLDGSKGEIKVRVKTELGTATEGVDYDPMDEVITFADNELEKIVNVKINDDETVEKNLTFIVTLSDIEGGTLGKSTSATVVIKNDDAYASIVQKVTDTLAESLDNLEETATGTKAKLIEAFTLPETKTPLIMFAWSISLPFSVAFSFIPDATVFGGWPCFTVSLMFIGFITALIGDFAGLLGCALGLKASVTAITIVALGTSLPDTFASKSAAIADDDADASLGNVTGSNSVNVFLGLGLPWLIAAIYWEDPSEEAALKWLNKYGGISAATDLAAKGDTGFVVPAGDLGFSVSVFAVLAVATISSILARRKIFKAELGGPYAKQFSILFVGFWFTYVLLSSLKAYGDI